MGSPAVTVVIPVYNMAQHLETCLSSIWHQSIGVENLEVVAVDDGSTDGSLEILEAQAAQHPELVVLRGRPSGAPGRPRNRGIERSRGEFVFFADPDDHLGPEALERMVAVARRNRTDVVLGRIRGVGRSAPTRPFQASVERGDIVSTQAVWSLTAHKLFRRDLLLEHDLRFAEGARLAEEQPLVVGAYVRADGISVVADYDCYYLVEHADAAHLTHATPDPATFFPIVRSSMEMVTAHTPPGPVRNGLLSRWVQLELAGKFSARFGDLPDHLRREFVDRTREILDALVPEEIDLALPIVPRVRIGLVRHGRADLLPSLAQAERSEARGVLRRERGRVFAALPGFRDPGGPVPDAYFEITRRPAAAHTPVGLAHDPMTKEVEVVWDPVTPAGAPPVATWSLELRREGEALTVPGVGDPPTARFREQELTPGTWALRSCVATDAEDDAAAVGAFDTVSDETRAALPVRWVGGELVAGETGLVWLVVRSGFPSSIDVAPDQVRWDDDTLTLAVHAPDAARPGELRLRRGHQDVLVAMAPRGEDLMARMPALSKDLGAGTWRLDARPVHAADRPWVRVRSPHHAGRPLSAWRRAGRRFARLESRPTGDVALVVVDGWSDMVRRALRRGMRSGSGRARG